MAAVVSAPIRKLNARGAAAKDWLLGVALPWYSRTSPRAVLKSLHGQNQARSIRMIDRVEDVMAAHRRLRRNRRRRKKIVLWGWSHGAAQPVLNTVTINPATEIASRLRVTSATTSNSSKRLCLLSRAVRPFAKTTHRRRSSPLTILMGDADDWTPAAPCSCLRRATEEQRAAGQHHALSRRYHDFDNPAGKPLRVAVRVPTASTQDRGVTIG